MTAPKRQPPASGLLIRALVMLAAAALACSRADMPAVVATAPATPAPTLPPRSSYSSPPYPPPSAVVPPFSSPTATIVPPNPVAVELADGKQIDAEATLRIEDIQSGQVSYLYIVLLADGEVKATVIE